MNNNLTSIFNYVYAMDKVLFNRFTARSIGSKCLFFFTSIFNYVVGKLQSVTFEGSSVNGLNTSPPLHLFSGEGLFNFIHRYYMKTYALLAFFVTLIACKQEQPYKNSYFAQANSVCSEVRHV